MPASQPTVQMQQQVAELYLSMLNRNPDPEGFAFWVNGMVAGQTQYQIAIGFSHAPEFDGVAAMTPVAAIQQLYQNILGRPVPADDPGVQFWANGIAGYQTVNNLTYREALGQIAVNIASSAFAQGYSTADGTYVNNAVNAAIVAGTTETATHTLTTSQFVYTGTNVDDIYNAPLETLGSSAAMTLQSVTSIDGAGGNNTLNALLNGSVTPFALTNIQNVYASTSNNATLGLVHAGQVENVANVASADGTTLTVSGIATGANLASVDNGTAASIFQFASTSGGSDTANLYLENSTGAVTINGIETINITSSGSATPNSVNLTANSAITVNIDSLGVDDQDLTLTGVAAATVIDASTFTANLTATLANAGDLLGGSGNDLLNGSAGNDIVDGGDGNNTIVGNGGNDILDAGNGNNTITGGSGNDVITTGSGNNTINAAGGNNSITTGDGNNSITATDGNDTVSTGAGVDTITVGNGANVISSGAGNDTITAGTGEDNIAAGDDNDSIIFAGNFTSADSVDGGTGIDTLTATAASLAAASTGALANVNLIDILTVSDNLNGDLINVANIDSTISTVNLTGMTNGTTGGLYLNPGATTVNLNAALPATGTLDIYDNFNPDGSVENVTLVKNYATDNDAFGGVALEVGGVETITLNTGSVAVTATQSPGSITINGEGPSDNLSIVAIGANEIATGAISTSSTGLLTIDLSGLTTQASGLTATITSTATSGTVSIIGSSGADVLNGDSNGSNTIRGGEGTDSILGGSAADSLDGGAGSDVIWGAGGDDTLKGNSGDDTITVATTGDVFTAATVSIEGGEGNDTVYIGDTLSIGDVVDGGDGTFDTLSETTALIASTTTVSNFEVLQLDAAITQNMALFATNTGFTRVNATTGANTINNANATLTTLALDHSVNSIVLDRASGVTNGAVTVQALQEESTSIATVTANEDVTVSFAAGAAAAGRTLTIGALDAVAATAINISGVQNTSVTIDASAADGGLGTTARTVTVNASSATGTVVYDGSTGVSAITQVITGSSTAASSLTGGAGGDTITLGNAATGNVAVGNAGNNTISGGTGNDSMTAGTGNDVITGNGGNDTVNAGDGTNTITMGSGNDSITSGSGADAIIAGGGNDTINAGYGNDVINAGAGQDWVNGEYGADAITLTADSTADRIQARYVTESIASTANTLDATIVAGNTLTFGSGVDVVTNFTAGSGSGYDVIGVRAGAGVAPTSLVGATAGTLSTNTVYYAAGTYNSLTGIFTITANNAGTDTLIMQVDTGTEAASGVASTNASAVILQGVVASTLTTANFVSATGLTATYASTVYNLVGAATGSISMAAANGVVTTSDTITYIGSYNQAAVTKIDASGITGGFGATINVTGGTSVALASVVGTSGNDTIVEATAVFGAAGSTVYGGAGNDTLRFTTYGSDTVGDTGAGIDSIEYIDLVAGATSLTLANGVTSVVAITNSAAASASTVVLGTGAAHTFTSGSTAADTVTLGLTGQTATFTDSDTDNVIAGAVVGSNVVMSAAGGNTLTIKAAASSATNAVDSLKANYTGGSGTDVLNLVAAATQAGVNTTTGTLTSIETIDLGAVGADVVVTLGTTTSLTSIKGETAAGGSKDITYNLSLAQLDSLTSIVDASANGTFTVATTATAGGSLNLAGMTITNVDVLDLGLSTSDVIVSGTAALVGAFGTIAGVGAGGTTTLTTTNDAALDLSAKTITLVDTVIFAGAGSNALTLDYADMVADNFTTLTGTGTSDLAISGGAVDLQYATITGFDQLTVGGALSIKAATFGGAITLVDTTATANINLLNSGDYSELTLTTGDFDTFALGSGVAATLSSTAFVGSSITAITGVNGGAAETFVVNAATATAAVNLGAVTTVTDLTSITINDGTGANTITVSATDAVRGITTVNLTDNASIDTVAIGAGTVDSTDVLYATVTGFGSTDVLNLTGNSTAFNAQYQSFTSAGATLTADTTGSVWSIQTTVGQLIDFTDYTAAKALIASAVGTATTLATDEFAVVIYGTNGAALYTIDTAAVTAADFAAADIDAIELVGVLSGAAANSLNVGNFA